MLVVREIFCKRNDVDLNVSGSQDLYDLLRVVVAGSLLTVSRNY